MLTLYLGMVQSQGPGEVQLLDEKGQKKGEESFPEEGAEAWLWANLLRTSLLKLIT